MTSDRELFEAAVAKEYGPRWRLVLRCADPGIVAWDMWQAAHRAEGADKLPAITPEPTDEQLTAAFKRTIGGPNPFYECVHCGKDFPGVRNELRDHWNVCIERRHAAAELAAGCTREVEKKS